MLDEKRRCCGRKPIRYQGGGWSSPPFPQRFCPRCDRAYDLEEDKQIENWAWTQKQTGKWVEKRKGNDRDERSG
ncbi:hypothetical protein LCGC14_1482290 [marine sediment metagenome]|uniref:Uncharacterized protein n=1 Tax=marine sediment metagenome TaxID=412755 RepID=A0A0F9J987_9ZZZZ